MESTKDTLEQRLIELEKEVKRLKDIISKITNDNNKALSAKRNF